MHRSIWLSIAIGIGMALVAAVPSSARILPANGMLPDGDTPPVVESVRLLHPQRHNELLEADLVVDAHDNDAVARYEYRWNGAAIGSIHVADINAPTVDYSRATPDRWYALELRAIDIHSNASDWYPVWSGITPSVPRVIVAGDSIASGYTRTWFTGDATCRDNGLSYGSAVAAGVGAGMPDAWAPEYFNIAWAGAGINSMLNGGTDSCGTSHVPQVDGIQNLVDDSSWNIVVVTAGINSTNWTDVIVGLTKDTAISFTKNGDRQACDLALHREWNIADRAAMIKDGSREIAVRLAENTNALLYWTGYYDITGSELAPLWTPIGDECSNELSEAMGLLHGALRAGLTSKVTWVDIDGEVATQSWAGWPHPSEAGHDAIAESVLASIRS